MNKWYIYLDSYIDKKTKQDVVSRRYYRKQLVGKHLLPNLKYIGEALLSDDYFITGSTTKFSYITDLNSVELEYTATLSNGRIATFTHSIQELLERAKEGILPYISFAQHKVLKKPKLIINGVKIYPNTKLNIDYE